MPSILFVCTANQFRSPLAAAILLNILQQDGIVKDWTVESAGTWTKDGLGIPAVTLVVAVQLGLGRLDRHRSRQINQKLLDDFDLIVVMEIGHKEAIRSEFPSVHGRVHMLSELVDEVLYDIPDPADTGINPQDIGRELYMLITKGKEKILRLAETLYTARLSEHG